MAQMNLSTEKKNQKKKNQLMDVESRLVVAKGEERRWDGLGVWG